MDTDQTLRLLIIDDSANDIEATASAVRNAGHAVRVFNADDEMQLLHAVKEQGVDMVLCLATSEEPSLAQVNQAVRQTRKDIPILALMNGHSDELLAQALATGATDVICKDIPEHIQHAVHREANNLALRRRTTRFQASLKETEKRCHALLDSSRDAITYVHEGMHVYANPVYLTMFGFQALDEVEGTPIMDMVSPEDHSKFKEFFRQYNRGDTADGKLEVMGLHPDGSTFLAHMELSPASIDGEPCTQIVIRDQSVGLNEELEKKLKYLSKQDLLTGLYNRHYFIEELNQAIATARDSQNVLGVIYFEPDRFKEIKEQVGIAGSDLVLSDIANVLRNFIDEPTIAARFGDTSFAVLAQPATVEAFTELADQIRRAVAEHICEVGGQTVTTTLSLGLSLINKTSTDTQDILSCADLACEVARKEGGNQAHLHNPIADENASKERDRHWIDAIHRALDHDGFFLVYQPVASLHGESGEKYEVLLRMRDDDQAEVVPAKFIPIAEQFGLIAQIDRWVITRTIQIAADRRRNGLQTTLLIKLAGPTFCDETLLPWLSQQLNGARLQGDSLIFQITESMATKHLMHAKALVNGLQQLRCGIALEHFGKSANSMQLLKHLPVNYLKLDSSFIHNLSADSERQGQVRAITEAAQTNNIATIAGFVEDPNSLAVLWQCGISYIQGHFLQQPEPAMNYDFEGEEA